jgi:hypothetical protein
VRGGERARVLIGRKSGFTRVVMQGGRRLVGSPSRVGRGSRRFWRTPRDGKEAVAFEVGWTVSG